jgi:pyrroloquinoline quinone (PQQ) biosynthesis protein C
MLRIKTATQFVEEMERTHYLQKICKADGVSVKSVLQNRPVPESHADLVEFFLSTESQEMNFEIARYRPR